MIFHLIPSLSASRGWTLQRLLHNWSVAIGKEMMTPLDVAEPGALALYRPRRDDYISPEAP